MNLTNIEKAIAIMERVKARGDILDMDAGQTGDGDGCYFKNEEEIHRCGTAACFAGWVAVSPEFKADGGRASSISGAPLLRSESADGAIAEWLGIEECDAANLCALENHHLVYGRASADNITVDDVLAALYRLRDTGSADMVEETSE